MAAVIRVTPEPLNRSRTDAALEEVKRETAEEGTAISSGGIRSPGVWNQIRAAKHAGAG